MGRRLSHGPCPVVAGPACTRHRRCMVEKHLTKRTGVVTVVTTTADLDVPERHRCGTALVVDDMATTALLGCALEYAFDVTGFAAHPLM